MHVEKRPIHTIVSSNVLCVCADVGDTNGCKAAQCLCYPSLLKVRVLALGTAIFSPYSPCNVLAEAVETLSGGFIPAVTTLLGCNLASTYVFRSAHIFG